MPLITWSLLGLLWTVSPVLALALVGGALVFYCSLSLRIALGMLAVSALLVCAVTLPGSNLRVVAGAVFVAAWIGQFIGHVVEGRKPSFLEDVKFLLVGPAWLLGTLYRRLGVRY